ncbi:MAG: molybdenum cofactor biosynthesis protein MoaE [Thermostichus sp. BF3_bins_97]
MVGSDSIAVGIPDLVVMNLLTALQTSFQITLAPLSIDRVQEKAAHPGNGAVVLMSGTVRDNTAGRPVDYLEYQAYEPMALKVFADIARQIQERWPEVNSVIIHHRIGKLRIGEISVLVAVGMPHRAEAFAACQFAIDTLKHNAPIWKKEHWRDGSSEWVSIGSCEEE